VFVEEAADKLAQMVFEADPAAVHSL